MLLTVLQVAALLALAAPLPLVAAHIGTTSAAASYRRLLRFLCVCVCERERELYAHTHTYTHTYTHTHTDIHTRTHLHIMTHIQCHVYMYTYRVDKCGASADFP